MYLGNTNHWPHTVNGVKVVKGTFKALGIYFGKDREETTNKNLEERYIKFKNVLTIWSQRGLSLKGKIVILKSLAIPQLTYATSVMYVPSAFIDKVDQTMLAFLWNNKPAKIKSSTVISEIDDGGLKMPNFKTICATQKVMWIKRLLSENNSRWKAVAYSLMGITHSQLTCKLSVEYLENIKTPFYQQVLKHWYDIYSKEPIEDDIVNEKLWNNRFILINRKPVNNDYIQWQRHGINTISELVNSEGVFLTLEQLNIKYSTSLQIMAYNSLIHAIPSKWKYVMRQNCNQNHGYDCQVETT